MNEELRMKSSFVYMQALLIDVFTAGSQLSPVAHLEKWDETKQTPPAHTHC